MGKLFADIHRLNFANQNLGILRNLNACQLCNLISALSYNLCIQRTVDQNGLSYLIQLFRLQEVAAAVCKFFLYFIVNSLLLSVYNFFYSFTDCSEAQIIPLSNVLEWMIEFTAILISAVSSRITGVFPAPTPSAGFPEE